MSSSNPTHAELLAPAGDWDCLRAAVENGADAVYFGLDAGFNARARATNFAVAELPQVMQFLHARNVRGYVTLNTLVFSDELHEAERHVRALAAQRVDAVLVQDLGLARMIHAICPGLVLHASTQMTLTSAPCIDQAQQLGISRVVLPRELSLREIGRVAKETSVQLEAFVHGALCVAYSGQCLTSESLGGRSANRGQCAQACRLPYTVICDGQDVDLGAQQYLLSPQDLAGFQLVPELLQAGVVCLKIEGRLKSPEYVANITRHYRRALDAALQGGRAEFSRHDVHTIEMSFSRGLSPGWLHGCDHKMLVPALSSAKRGSRLGAVVSVRGPRVRVALELPVKRGDGVGFDVSASDRQQQGGRVYEIFEHGKSLTHAAAGQTVDLAFARDALALDQIQPGHTVWKTDDPALNKALRKSFSGPPRRRVPLDVHVKAVVGQALHVTCSTPTGIRLEFTSDRTLAAATQHPLTIDVLRTQLGRLGNTIYQLRHLQLEPSGRPMVPLSVLGQMRRRMIDGLQSRQAMPARPIRCGDLHVDQLREAWISCDKSDTGHRPQLHVLCRDLQQLRIVSQRHDVDRVYADFQDIREYRQAVQLAHRDGREIFLATPRIQKPDELGIFHVLARYGPDGVLARNLAGLSFFAQRHMRVVADFSMNAANEFTVDLLRRWGAELVTPSYDLNRDQLIELVRNVPSDWLEMVIHQHMPMFHMEHCVFCAVLSPGTNKTNCGRPCDVHQVTLRDRVGMQHPLKADVGCRNTLFNAQAQSAAEVVAELLGCGVRRFRVELLEQDRDAIRQAIDLYLQLLHDQIEGREVVKQLNACNRVGVTRGTLESERDPLAIL